MPTYCSMDRINAKLENKVQVTATSAPTVAQVTTWMDQVEAMVNVALGAVATDAVQITALGLLCEAEVIRMIRQKLEGPSEDTATPSKDFLAALELMRDGEWSPSPDSGEPWATTMNSTDDFPSDPYGPAVKKDRVF
jgi:hypothetical protein